MGNNKIIPDFAGKTFGKLKILQRLPKHKGYWRNLRMKVIALSGWKGSGKDTAAEYLIKEHGFVRQAFADVLKDMVAEQYNIPRSWCDDPNFKEKGLSQYPVSSKDNFSKEVHNIIKGEFVKGVEASDPRNDELTSLGGDTLFWSPRALCILEGSIKRSVNSNYWVDRVIQEITSDKPDYNWNYVISDLRYRSEVVRLKESFGNDLVTVRINRFDNVNTNDASERDLDNHQFDVVLLNKGTKEELYAQINNLIGA